jgi:hypothetical protein
VPIFDEWEQEFVYLINGWNFEWGMGSPACDMVEKLLGQYGTTWRWLFEMLAKHSDNRAIFIGILQVMVQMDSKDETLYAVAMMAVRHEDDEVKEIGVRLCENFSNKLALTILKGIKFKEGWLDHYRAEVIVEIEREDNGQAEKA